MPRGKVTLPKHIGWAYNDSDKVLASEVMAFHTFEDCQTDILEILIDETDGILRNCEPIRTQCEEYIIQIQEGYLDNMTRDEGIDFFDKVVDAINYETGKNIKYAVWLSPYIDVKYIRYNYSPKPIFHEPGPITFFEDMENGEILFGYEEYPETIYYESFRKVNRFSNFSLYKTNQENNLDTKIRDAQVRSDSYILKMVNSPGFIKEKGNEDLKR